MLRSGGCSRNLQDGNCGSIPHRQEQRLPPVLVRQLYRRTRRSLCVEDGWPRARSRRRQGRFPHARQDHEALGVFKQGQQRRHRARLAADKRYAVFYVYRKLRSEPLLGCGKTSCACGKKHGGKKLSRVCATCKLSFNGTCAADNLNNLLSEHWECKGCVARVAHEAECNASLRVQVCDLLSGVPVPTGAKPADNGVAAAAAPGVVAATPFTPLPAASAAEKKPKKKKPKPLTDRERTAAILAASPLSALFQLPDGTSIFEAKMLDNPDELPPTDTAKLAEVFRSGRSISPRASEVTGGLLLAISLIANIDQSPLRRIALEGLSRKVREWHLSELQLLKQFVTSNYEQVQHLTLDQVVMYYITMQYVTSIKRNRSKGAERGWQPQTLHRELLNLQGALAALPFYATNVPFGISLKDSAEFNGLMKRLQHLSMEAQPTGQRAVSFDEMKKAVELEEKSAIKIALILMWLTAGRVGDILKLKMKSVKTGGARNLDITFEEGKGVTLSKGKYSVHTVMPECWRAQLMNHFASLKPTDLIVPPTEKMSMGARGAACNKALQRVDKFITTRSIRRGSLQAMAMGSDDMPPVDLATLMSYAGHLREATTKRYLDWGRLFGDAAQRQRAAAALLHPPPGRV